MRKSHILLMIATLFLAQSLFAFNDNGPSKSCRDVAKACLDAGYGKDEPSTKRFWQDCMRPVLLGQKVEGVTLDNDIIRHCRTDKIGELKKDLSDLEKVKN